MLNAVVVALGVFILLWKPESSVTELLRNFLFVFVPALCVLTAIMLLEIFEKKKRLKSRVPDQTL